LERGAVTTSESYEAQLVHLLLLSAEMILCFHLNRSSAAAVAAGIIDLILNK
jgi:hypothetical protein